MKSFLNVVATLPVSLILLTSTALADDWSTVANDAQRSGWVRADSKISMASVQSPEFQLMWKMALGDEASDGGSLSAPVLLDFLISHRGFRSLGFLAGSSGSVYVMDTDLARPEWDRPFGATSVKGTAECPGGMTANLSRPTVAALPALGGFAPRGRRGAGKSGVGKPNEGAVTLAKTARRAPAPRPTQEDTRVRPPAGRSLRGLALVYALTSDGLLHSLFVSNGHDHVPPIRFVPANANARGLIVIDNVAYVATKNGCGGAPDGVWALDLESKKVTTWKSADGIAGLVGSAVGPDGVLYAATARGGIVALEAKTLKQLAASEGTGFQSSPVVIDYKGGDYIAAAGLDGSLQLLDAKNLSASAVASEPFSDTHYSPGALATWRDSSGTNWLLAPSVKDGKGAIVAWKLADNSGSPSLEMGWKSPSMSAPLPPVIVNGIVFAVDGGGSNAKLHALDGATGKPLWDSGDSITSTAAGYALSSGPAHVYVSSSDGILYSFGIPIEH